MSATAHLRPIRVSYLSDQLRVRVSRIVGYEKVCPTCGEKVRGRSVATARIKLTEHLAREHY